MGPARPGRRRRSRRLLPGRAERVSCRHSRRLRSVRRPERGACHRRRSAWRVHRRPRLLRVGRLAGDRLTGRLRAGTRRAAAYGWARSILAERGGTVIVVGPIRPRRAHSGNAHRRSRSPSAVVLHRLRRHRCCFLGKLCGARRLPRRRGIRGRAAQGRASRPRACAERCRRDRARPTRTPANRVRRYGRVAASRPQLDGFLRHRALGAREPVGFTGVMSRAKRDSSCERRPGAPANRKGL